MLYCASKDKKRTIRYHKKEIIMIHHIHKCSISMEHPERGYTVTHRIDISCKTFFFTAVLLVLLNSLISETVALFLK